MKAWRGNVKLFEKLSFESKSKSKGKGKVANVLLF